MRQKRTSAATSINGNKLPKIFQSKLFTNMAKPGDTVLDYGCGKYDNTREYCENIGLVYRGYDPYNRTMEENVRAIGDAEHRPDYVVMSNVLNVIDNEEARQEALQLAISQARKALFVTIYEGDKTGIGRETKRDCWQENRLVESYYDDIVRACESLGRGTPDFKRIGNMFCVEFMCDSYYVAGIVPGKTMSTFDMDKATSYYRDFARSVLHYGDIGDRAILTLNGKLVDICENVGEPYTVRLTHKTGYMDELILCDYLSVVQLIDIEKDVCSRITAYSGSQLIYYKGTAIDGTAIESGVLVK